MKDNQYKPENENDVNSGKEPLDKETELVKRKQRREGSQEKSWPV